MRHKPEYVLLGALSAFALTGALATVIGSISGSRGGVDSFPAPGASPGGAGTASDAVAWFQSMRPFCNAVDVETHLRWQPAPPTSEGEMQKAACLALAGRIERAREVIQGLPGDERYKAAGVVFEAGHPAADAGDDIAAGPLMELVVEYWPNHYMALYHAGAARFETGDYETAAGYLERFLDEYSAEDGWRSSATSMLDRIASASS